jgi:hypothetical protein
MAKSYRVTLQLSEDEFRLLTLWARWHGKPKATYAGQIVSSRIESNAKLIYELVEMAAKDRGTDFEELKAAWLSEKPERDVEEIEETDPNKYPGSSEK